MFMICEGRRTLQTIWNILHNLNELHLNVNYYVSGLFMAFWVTPSYKIYTFPEH